MATAKKKLTTVFDKYLSVYPNMEELQVVQGKFDDEFKQMMFHFDLMASKLPYFAYDGCGKTATILLPKMDSINADNILNLMENNGIVGSKINAKATIVANE